MKLNFLESGIDSLKKGFDSLIEYENIQYYNTKEDSAKSRFFYLKDAILFIQHGVEILFKQLIHEHSQYLIFSQIDDNVKKALKEKNDKQLKSVFESELKHKLHTVNFVESIERLKIIPLIQLNSKLEKKLKQLEVYRNIIMHSEPHLNEIDINNTFDGLADELDNFFFESIGKEYKTISNYGELISTFKNFEDILRKKGLELKVNSTNVLIDSLKYSKISMGHNEVKRITDINSCMKFLEKMFNSNLRFGTDLFNGYCSGSIKQIKRISNDCFSMHAEDNNSFYEFKLKSIIIMIPNISDERSPIIFIESDSINIEKENAKFEIEEFYEIKSARYYRSKIDESLIYNLEELETITDEYDEESINWKNYDDLTKFFTGGLFCFINVQGLEYNKNYKRFIYKNKTMDGKQFEVILRKILKEDIEK